MAIGGTARGGICRLTLTDLDRQVRDWFRRRTEALGCTVTVDDMGTMFARRPGGRADVPPIAIGSHLDTQPTGGKFDGVLGVLAAVEALRTMVEAGYETYAPIEVVNWTNEEGSRFAPALIASGVFAGVFDPAWARGQKDRAGVTFGEALQAIGYRGPERCGDHPLSAFFELHIEQGPLLEAAKQVIGVVTGIQGKKTYQVIVEGAEGHAGTLAQTERRDALASFARMASALHAEIGTVDADIKFTIGRVTVEPNAPSVVPSRVTFSIDLRHPDNAVLDAAGARVVAICETHAPPCAVTVKPLVDAPSNEFDPQLRERIARAARAQDFPAMPILSAAGHDARHLAKVCPSAMIFIPCRDGASHVEHEWSEPAHVAAGAAVLAQVMTEIVF